MPIDEQEQLEPAVMPVDEGFHIHDEGSANWVLKKIVAEREYRARVLAWYEAETRRSERREQFLLHRFGAELADFVKQSLATQHDKRRSIHLPAGVVGFRTMPSKLVVIDEAKLLAWCRANLPGAITVIERLAKTEIHSHFKSTGELPDGAELGGGDEQFFIK